MPKIRADARRLAESAYREVKHRILMNVYPGGFQVLEEALCEDLGMSRTPLREALVRLQIEGLVEVMPRRGVRVLPLDSSDVAAIYEVLSSLEILAAKLLAERDDNVAAVKRLQGEVDGMKRALQSDDLDAWAAADERFHRILVDESGNPRLAAARCSISRSDSGYSHCACATSRCARHAATNSSSRRCASTMRTRRSPSTRRTRRDGIRTWPS